MWNPDMEVVKRGKLVTAQSMPNFVGILAEEKVFLFYLKESEAVRKAHGIGKNKEKRLYIEDLEKFCALRQEKKDEIERLLIEQV